MFRQWCKHKGFFHGKELSHVLMDGGVLSVPFDRLEEFYEKCIQCIKGGEKIFVVEQKTETYNFFLDIDYKDEEALELEQVLSICKVIFTKVKTFSHEDQKVLVSVSKPKPKDGLIKTGIHLNWPGMVVDQYRSIQLMYHIVAHLNSIYSAKDWSKYIDSSVYGDLATGTKGSGFRMIWSHKNSKHAECKGVGCVVCNNTGRLVEGEYLPVYMIDHSGVTELDQTPTKDILWQSTVRTEETVCVDIPEHQPIVFRVQKGPKKEGDFTKTQMKDEVYDQELFQLLESFIRKNMKGQENSRVQKIFKTKDCFLLKTDSRYCENLSRNHSSNHVWFFISKNKTICQKCFCRCNTMEGRRKFCKDFSGREHNLSETIKKKLILKSK